MLLSSRRKQRGVGLIEIMVAVLLLSVGFLSAARMQVQSMRFSQSAYLESQAYFMISDIMDRMRGNVNGVLADAYSGKETSDSVSDPGCASAYCSPTQLAQQDIYDWSSNLHDLRSTANFTPLLPGTASTPAKGEIIEKADGVFEIKVTWYEKIGQLNQAQSLSLDFVPWL